MLNSTAATFCPPLGRPSHQGAAIGLGWDRPLIVVGGAGWLRTMGYAREIMGPNAAPVWEATWTICPALGE